MGLAWIIAATVFVADFFIKTYLRINFFSQSIPVIKNILYLTVICNKGAAFGILHGKTTLLVYISLIFIFTLFLFVRNERKKSLLFLVSCGMILGGALSNLCDRIVLGCVVDYIDLKVWPVFNLSDSCITAGAAMLIFSKYGVKAKDE